jgi:hypothetical protein
MQHLLTITLAQCSVGASAYLSGEVSEAVYTDSNSQRVRVVLPGALGGGEQCFGQYDGEFVEFLVAFGSGGQLVFF